MSTISRRKRKRLQRRAEATAKANGTDCRWDWANSPSAADVALAAHSLAQGWDTPPERLNNIAVAVLNCPGASATKTGTLATLGIIRGLIRSAAQPGADLKPSRARACDSAAESSKFQPTDDGTPVFVAIAAPKPYAKPRT